MNIVFDKEKDQKNQDKHGVSLAIIAELDWDAALVLQDERQDYREHRYRVFAPCGKRLYAAAVTWRNGKLRGISIRKANTRERKRYEKEIEENIALER